MSPDQALGNLQAIIQEHVVQLEKQGLNASAAAVGSVAQDSLRLLKERIDAQGKQ